MNIGVVTVWGDRGASVVSEAYIDSLSKNNRVFIYSRGGEAKIKHSDNTQNVYLGKETHIPITTHINKNDFITWVTSNKIELVLFNEQHWFEPLLWLKVINVKSVSYVDYYTEETIPLFNLYDGLICNTHRHYQAFKKHKNALYIPWGLDVNKFTLTQNTSDKNQATFFHSCGMNPLRKGTDLLLKATAKLSGNFKLIIHSQLDLFSYYNENIDILDCIKTLKESGKLTIITKSVSAPGLYNLGNVYVYPCRLDGLGLTVPEALSSGLPTIVPNAEPMKDFISPSCSLIAIDRFYCRKDGYYWPQQLCDIDDLKHKMENYITDDQLEEKMSVARSHALENLDWQKNSAELNIFIASTKVLPIDSITADTYDKYKHYGYRKIITTIERLSFIFSPIYTIYHKLKKR